MINHMLQVHMHHVSSIKDGHTMMSYVIGYRIVMDGY